MNKTVIRPILLVVIALSACTHQVAFQEVNYAIATKQRGAEAIGVIDQQTLAKEVTIKSQMAGSAQDWNAQPGLMLKQVSDVEFSQIFSNYRFSTTDSEIQANTGAYKIIMTVPYYDITGFRAHVTVHFKVFNADEKELLDQYYMETGVGQETKVILAGPFGMKSAMQTSSLDAFKRIFARMRVDLENLLNEEEDRRTVGVGSAPRVAKAVEVKPRSKAERPKKEKREADPRYLAANKRLGLGDDAAAWILFCQAAHDGDQAAQRRVGWYYRHGRAPVQTNLVLAYEWYTLAESEEGGYAEAEKAQIARKMTAEQIAEAERLARAWTPNPSECEKK